MHHYPHHIGDYRAHTAHLTMTEDGCYRRLLDLCYMTERPLPGDIAAVQRLAGARDKTERAAVETILREFFELREDGWRQDRVARELAAYQARVEVARRNGNRSAGRPKTQSKPTDNQVGYSTDTGTEPSEGLTLNLKPITSNQVEVEAHKRAQRIPEDWKPSEELSAWVIAQGLNPEEIANNFKDYWRSESGAKARKLDWDAAFRVWCRRQTGQPSSRPQARSFDERKRDAASTVSASDDKTLWAIRVKDWKKSRFWNPTTMGPPPGEPGCQVPRGMLEEARQ